MFVFIKEKRILFIVTAVIISLMGYAGVKVQTQPKWVQINTHPVSNKVIIIDAGHRVSRWRSNRYKWNNRK